MQNQDLITAIAIHFDQLAKNHKLAENLLVTKGLHVSDNFEMIAQYPDTGTTDILSISWSEIQNNTIIDSYLAITVKTIVHHRRYHETTLPTLRYLGSE
jgi:thioesterase domain-containing protein